MLAAKASGMVVPLPLDHISEAVRTAVDVEGDMVGSQIVQKLTEKELPGRIQ